MNPSDTFRVCQSGGCVANIFVLAGQREPCAICAPHVQPMREMLKWTEISPGFYFSEPHLTEDQKARLRAVAIPSTPNPPGGNLFFDEFNAAKAQPNP